MGDNTNDGGNVLSPRIVHLPLDFLARLRASPMMIGTKTDADAAYFGSHRPTCFDDPYSRPPVLTCITRITRGLHSQPETVRMPLMHAMILRSDPIAFCELIR